MFAQAGRSFANAAVCSLRMAIVSNEWTADLPGTGGWRDCANFSLRIERGDPARYENAVFEGR
jgi:hypothetical protein